MTKVYQKTPHTAASSEAGAQQDSNHNEVNNKEVKEAEYEEVK